MKPRRFNFKKAAMIFFCAAGMITLVSFIVMLLWNAILPQVTSATPINFWQALGLLLLCKILFGGFGGGRGRPGWGKRGWGKRPFEKWQTMSQEDREAFRQKMRSRCGSWGRFREPEESRQAAQPGAAGTE
ncbi:MAG: hypothetical protein P0Y53_03540 [Candidatus Pseudobacter hemicellulosilyticus]|uniref:Uncharacterized protein n=1 Tax=Candidatus Pseudobacter hemicellulosilyticus TaxID=3121375 RepID=A0AAJ5WU29_9BACT|nr:MAG: hypothetical protein P0Y53_03540 [Pseudobacter sp.]